MRADLIQTIDERLWVNAGVDIAQIPDTVGVIRRPERIGQYRSDRLGGGQIPAGDEAQVAIGSHRTRSGTRSRCDGGWMVRSLYLESRVELSLGFQLPWRVTRQNENRPYLPHRWTIVSLYQRRADP